MAKWLFGQQPEERSQQFFPRLPIPEVLDHCQSPSNQMLFWGVEQKRIHSPTAAWLPFSKMTDGYICQSLQCILKKDWHRQHQNLTLDGRSIQHPMTGNSKIQQLQDQSGSTLRIFKHCPISQLVINGPRARAKWKWHKESRRKIRKILLQSKKENFHKIIHLKHLRIKSRRNEKIAEGK